MPCCAIFAYRQKRSVCRFRLRAVDAGQVDRDVGFEREEAIDGIAAEGDRGVDFRIGNRDAGFRGQKA